MKMLLFMSFGYFSFGFFYKLGHYPWKPIDVPDRRAINKGNTMSSIVTIQSAGQMLDENICFEPITK